MPDTPSDGSGSDSGRSRSEGGQGGWRIAALTLKVLAVAIAVLLVLLFVSVARRRAGYDFDLEWMEGAMLAHVSRLLRGEALYVAPSIEFVSYIYNPFFYVAAAPFTLVFGIELVALRLVSIVATFVTFYLVYRLVKLETHACVPAVIAVGMYAGCYPLTDGWFDVARVDSLCLALVLGAFLAARNTRQIRGALGAALLTFLAFETKQSALAIWPAIGVYLWVSRGLRLAAGYFCVAGGLVGATTLAFHVFTDGWYTFYAFRVPAGFGEHPEQYTAFWSVEIFRQIPVLAVLATCALAFSRGARTLAFRLLFGGALVGTSLIVRPHEGSFVNDLMPSLGAFAVLSGIGLHALQSETRRGRRVRAEVSGYAIALMQLTFLWYAPDKWLPLKADTDEGQRLVATVGSHPGDVLVWHHWGVSRRAGKLESAHLMAVWDVMRTRSEVSGERRTLEESVNAAFAGKRFSAVVLDDTIPFKTNFERYYRAVEPRFIGNPNALLCRTGAAVRPRTLWVPK